MLEMVGLVFHSLPASWTQRNKSTLQNGLLSFEIEKKYTHTHTHTHTHIWYTLKDLT